MELSTYVAAIKRAEAGDSVGYGRRFIAARATWIATMPIGYADGVRRGLTNNCDVLIDGRRYPLVGTVSMDNITADLGPERSRRVGRRAGDPDRALRRRTPDGGGSRPPAGHDQPRGAVRDLGACAAPLSPRRDAGAVSDPIAALAEIVPDGWLVGGTVRDRVLGRETADFDVATAGSAADRRPRAGPGGGRLRLRAVRGLRRLADRRPRPHLAGRRAAAQRGDDRGGPGPARPDHQRHRRAAGRRWATSTRSAGWRTSSARRLRAVSPVAFERDPLRAAAPGTAGLRAGLHGRRRRRRSWPGRRRPDWPGSRPSACSPSCGAWCARPAAPGGAGAHGCDRGHRCGAARAGGAARRRAEPLSPPRRGRSHPLGAGRGDRAGARSRAAVRAITRRRSRGSSPNRWPTT